MTMIRFITCVALSLCVIGLAVVAGQQTPVFRGTGDAVRVFVTVTDADGRLVTTLTRENFEVRDEGKPQPITLFDNTPQPIRLIVMLDVSGSMQGNLPLLRAAADQLFARLRPDDVAKVGSFGREVSISPSFTHDVNELRSALPKMIAPDAPTPLWRALDAALDAFGEDRDAGPVILVLSDGKDSGLFDVSFSQQPISQAEIIDRARSESVMIYAVGMRSRGAHVRWRSRGSGRGGLQAMMMADQPDPGSRACRAGNGRRLHRDSCRRGSRRRICARGRRAAQPIPDWLRSTETRRQESRHRRPAHRARADSSGAQELCRAEELVRSQEISEETTAPDLLISCSRSSSLAICRARVSAACTLGRIFASPTCRGIPPAPSGARAAGVLRTTTTCDPNCQLIGKISSACSPDASIAGT